MKDSYRVDFRKVPKDKKVATIKILRGLSGLGLKDAKDIVEETMGIPIWSNEDNSPREKEYSEPTRPYSLVVLEDKNESYSIADLLDLGAKIELGISPNMEAVEQHLKDAILAAAMDRRPELVDKIVSILEELQ